jgi:hypothetical protein
VSSAVASSLALKGSSYQCQCYNHISSKPTKRLHSTKNHATRPDVSQRLPACYCRDKRSGRFARSRLDMYSCKSSWRTVPSNGRLEALERKTSILGHSFKRRVCGYWVAKYRLWWGACLSVLDADEWVLFWGWVSWHMVFAGFNHDQSVFL